MNGLFPTQSVELLERVLPTLHSDVARMREVSVEQLVDSTLEGGFSHHLASREAVVKAPAV
jgi:hypothetical protein